MVQVLIGALIISFSPVFVKLVHVGPTSALFYRFLFGWLALLSVALLRKEVLWKNIHTLKWSFIGGVVFVIDLFFWHRSVHYIGPGLATIIANFQVFFMAAVGVLFFNEKLSLRFVIAVPLAFTGLLLIVGWQFDQMDFQYKTGLIYGVLTAVCYTCLTLTIKKTQTLESRVSPLVNMMWVCFFGALVGSFLVYPSQETFVIPDFFSLVILFCYGVLCTGVGWICISKGITKVSVSAAGLTLVLQPTGAFIWDLVFFSRPTTFVQMLGACLALSAIYMGALRSPKKRLHAPD